MATTLNEYLEAYRDRNASNTLIIGFEQPRTDIIRYTWLDLTDKDDAAWSLFVHACKFSTTSDGRRCIKFRPTQDQAFRFGNLPNTRTLCKVEKLRELKKAWQVNWGMAFENLLSDTLGAKQIHGSEPWWDEPDLELKPDSDPFKRNLLEVTIQVKLGFVNAATVMILE